MHNNKIRRYITTIHSIIKGNYYSATLCYMLLSCVCLSVTCRYCTKTT